MTRQHKANTDNTTKDGVEGGREGEREREREGGRKGDMPIVKTRQVRGEREKDNGMKMKRSESGLELRVRDQGEVERETCQL